MVGAYPVHKAGKWDMKYGSSEDECERSTEAIKGWFERGTQEKVLSDPVFGNSQDAPLAKHWWAKL